MNAVRAGSEYPTLHGETVKDGAPGLRMREQALENINRAKV
ncbi:MAG TPA: hypothetical protein VK627_06930 [Edaphobacter sp.]|nr:hypothetical protein [Edaphobacter sp.]